MFYKIIQVHVFDTKRHVIKNCLLCTQNSSYTFLLIICWEPFAVTTAGQSMLFFSYNGCV